MRLMSENLKRLVATTEYDNFASQAVMTKLGMRLERNPFPEPPWLQLVGILDKSLDHGIFPLLNLIVLKLWHVLDIQHVRRLAQCKPQPSPEKYKACPHSSWCGSGNSCPSLPHK